MEADQLRHLDQVWLAVANYYVTTFSIWFGHWYAHRRRSPLAPFHVLGHHLFYPDSRHMLSTAFIYGRGAQSSIYALLPWLMLQTCIQFLILPLGNYLLCLAGQIMIVVVINQIHTEFHLRDSRWERFAWFNRARRRHALHHDCDENYMVLDHFWDRVCGTLGQEDFANDNCQRTPTKPPSNRQTSRQLLAHSFVQHPQTSAIFNKPRLKSHAERDLLRD